MRRGCVENFFAIVRHIFLPKSALAAGMMIAREKERGGGGQQACWHGIPIRTAAAFMHPRCVQLEMEAGAQHPQIIAYFAANILPHHYCYSQQLFTYLMQINSWKFFGKYVNVSFKTRLSIVFSTFQIARQTQLCLLVRKQSGSIMRSTLAALLHTVWQHQR